MKATLARLGIRNFKPTLRNGLERLGTLQTPRSTRGRSRKSRVLHQDYPTEKLNHFSGRLLLRKC